MVPLETTQKRVASTKTHTLIWVRGNRGLFGGHHLGDSCPPMTRGKGVLFQNLPCEEMPNFEIHKQLGNTAMYQHLKVLWSVPFKHHGKSTRKTSGHLVPPLQTN